MQHLARFTTFVELKEFVYKTLCQREHLVVGAFPMSERILHRQGCVCGVLFVVHGPRSVIFNAVWETERNLVLFYGSSGQRFQTMRLVVAPQIGSSMLARPKAKGLGN